MPALSDQHQFEAADDYRICVRRGRTGHAKPERKSRMKPAEYESEALLMGKRYTVSDGKLVPNLEEAEEGGYNVTSPLNPELITQAETIEEAFANARNTAN